MNKIWILFIFFDINYFNYYFIYQDFNFINEIIIKIIYIKKYE